MNWPTCPFKFATGEQCQLALGHEKRDSSDHRFEQSAVRKQLPNGGEFTGYKPLTESARPPPRKRGRR